MIAPVLFWVMDEHKPSVRRDSNVAEDLICVRFSGKSKRRQAKITTPFQAFSLKRESQPGRRSRASIDPSYYGQGKGKKGKDTGDRGKPFKGVKKGKQKDSAKAASSTGDQANASLRAHEATVAGQGMNGTKTATMMIKDGAMPHTASSSLTRMQHATFASNRWARKKNGSERRTKGSSGRDTDPNPRKNPVSNTYESFHSLIPVTTGQEEGRGFQTATAVFPMQHTVLSVLTEHINIDRNPTCIILFDPGCTRAMGSRYAVNRRIKAVELYAPGKIEFTLSPSNTKFSFADSETALIKEGVALWFKTMSP